jgi:DNA primase
LQPLSASQRESLEEAVTSYEAAVTPAAAAYLKARGLTKAEAVTFRLGVVADPFPGHERFRGRLVIPYLDRDGKPLTVRFRCMSDHDHREFGHGKYMSMTDDPSRVFNVRAIHQAGDEIHVTEGEFDAIILSKIGLPAVAIPGAKAWKGHHRRMLAGFSRVYVWGDPDDAGAEFVQKVTRSLRSAKGVRLRGGDVTDTYLAGGADALLALIARKEEG